MNSNPDMLARNKRKLLMNTRRQSDTNCLIWDGQISNAGYGRVMLRTDDGNKMLSAPRAAYQLFIGPLGKEEIVTQSCRNRLCINPDHLETVDQIPLDYWHRRRD
jgi:hypothetical protein